MLREVTMYLPDLSVYPHATTHLLSVGWLDGTHSFATGLTSFVFQSKLALFCDQPTFVAMGRYTCDLCGKATGSGQIWIFGIADVIYVSPTLILHYVVDHRYLPPAEYIEAVMKCELPSSVSYQRRVEQHW